MMLPGRFTAVLDACVLYPAPVRDLFLQLAAQELYRPKWSDLIQKEWKRNVLEQRPDLKASQLDRTVRLMNQAFPDAQVDDFSNLIGGITLPDADDRHVVAAAVRTEADVIVTFNLKDFPAEVLYPYGIEPMHPDAFVVGLIEHDALRVTAAIRRQIDSLRSPPLSSAQVLATSRKLGLTKSSDRLEALLG